MKKNMIFIISIIAIFLILVGSIAYYRVIVKGKINASSGNAVFVLKDENSNEWNNKEIDLGKINPGDRGSFTITMDASSSNVDMYATLELDREALPTNLKFYTTSDYKSELHKYYSFLEKDGTSSETLTIYWYWNPYIDDEEDSKFINKENMEANIKVNAVQISEYAMMKNGWYDGNTEFWNNAYKPYIRTITFGSDLSNLPNECNEENLCWDISYSATQNKRIYGYLKASGLNIDETDSTTNTTTKPLYNLYIVSDAMIFAPINSMYLFSEFIRLIQIDFNNNFNTSKVTNMYGMFSWCSSLINLDLSSFDTTEVAAMAVMFDECQSLENLDIGNFITSKVTEMTYMFLNCKSLKSLDLSSFNTSNVTIMAGMFYDCKSIEKFDLKSFNTLNVTNMSGMFEGCEILTSLDLSGFNTSNVTNMGSMFMCCFALTSLNLSNSNTSKVTDMRRMFYCCKSLISLDLNKFNTSNVTDMYLMFSHCYKLQTEITIMNPNVTNYTEMFYVAAIDSSSKIIVNYNAETESLVDNMILTKSSNSNVVKRKQI